MFPIGPWIHCRQYKSEELRPASSPEPKGVRVLYNCFLAPNGTGLLDHSGEPIRGTYLERGPEKNIDIPFGKPPTIPSSQLQSVEEVVDRILFLPFARLSHFGHLLTEGAAWFWPFLDESVRPDLLLESNTTVFFPDRQYAERPLNAPQTPLTDTATSCESELSACLAKIIDVPEQQLRTTNSLRSPVACRQAIVPLPSMVNRRFMAEHQLEASRQVVNRTFQLTKDFQASAMDLASQPDSQKRIYLSRSRLPTYFRHVLEEDALASDLKSRGWQIVYPEQLPMEEQVRTLAEARVIAGEAGSAFHLLMYFGKTFARKLVITLGVNRPNRDQRVHNLLLQFHRQSIDHIYLACLRFGPPCDVQSTQPLHHRRFCASTKAIANQIEAITSRYLRG
jgi:hypothetical protein